MGNPKTDFRPFITVQTKQVPGTWLYDTGASVSCMSLQQIPAHCATSLPSAKTENTVVGMYNLNFSILGKSFQHPVHVCHPMNQGGILSMDIITLLGLPYLPARKTFMFDSHIAVKNSKQFKAETIFKKSAGVIAALITDRQLKIPPHTQCTVRHCVPLTVLIVLIVSRNFHEYGRLKISKILVHFCSGLPYRQGFPFEKTKFYQNFSQNRFTKTSGNTV